LNCCVFLCNARIVGVAHGYTHLFMVGEEVLNIGYGGELYVAGLGFEQRVVDGSEFLYHIEDMLREEVR